MKKSLILFSVAALALVSCAKVQDTYTGTPESREIAFSAVNLPSTKTTIVNGAVFPTDYNFYIAAYSASPAPAGDFFAKSEFGWTSTGTIWSGIDAANKKYWPLGDATLNFLAITKAGARTTTFNATHPANSVVVDFTDNSAIGTQHDLMWSYAQAKVQQVDNGLSFNHGETAGVTPVAMVFQHAESQVNFTIKAGDAVTESAGLTLTSITLNDAIYAGTYTLTFADYAATTVPSAPTGVWSEVTDPTTSNPEVIAPQTTPNMAITQTSGAAVIGDGILVVPNPNVDGEIALKESFKSFTIAYKMNDRDYTFTYIPDIAKRRLVQDTKYVFNITMTLTEIQVSATVEDWTAGFTGTAGDVSVPTI